MKVIKGLTDDLRAWLEFKRPRIGGSNAKASSVPLKYGADKTPSGMWNIVGALLTEPVESEESVMQRGHTLEAAALEELKSILGLEFDGKPGVWVSDEDDLLMLSSDGCEPGEKITYDAEIKSLQAGKHFKLLYNGREMIDRYYDLVPADAKNDYRHQILHGFIVNKELKTRYFVSYCPEAIYPEHRLVILPIKREEVEEEIADLEEYETKTLKRVRSIVEELVGNNF